MTNGESGGVWDGGECALVLMDYQDNTLGNVFEQDRRVIELNVRTLAAAAISLSIPVVLSSVGVGMGLNGPTIPSLQAVLPDHVAIDRTTTNAWEDPAFLAAVEDVYATYFGELAPLKLTPQYQDPVPLLKASAAGNA